MSRVLKGNYIKNNDYYENYLPKQTFKFKTLFDAYDKIEIIWDYCRYKRYLLEISFKVIIDDFEGGKSIRITKGFLGCHYGLV